MPACKLFEQLEKLEPTVAREKQFVAGQDGLPSIRIAVADANVMACRLLSDALQREEQFKVVATAIDGASLQESIRSTVPDIALLNSHLQDGPLSGLTQVREIRKEFPTLRIVVLLDRAEPQLVVEAFRAGARGIFSRTESDPSVLFKCISRVYEGQIWADSEQLHFLLEHLSSPPGANGSRREASLLTAREQTVVRLVAEGMGNREIAQRLKLSEHTVKNYMFRIFEKLGLSNRVELVLYAVTNLLLAEGPDERVPSRRAPGVPSTALAAAASSGQLQKPSQ